MIGQGLLRYVIKRENLYFSPNRGTDWFARSISFHHPPGSSPEHWGGAYHL